MVGAYACRRCPRRGGWFSSSPANPAFSLLSCFLAPYPPSPLPQWGRGILSFLMQGAPPLASPVAEPGRHLQPLPSKASGGVAGFLPRLPTLLLACFLAFLPPIPLPPFPSGEGGFLVFLCKGLRPLHPRWLNPGGTYSPCQAKHPAGWLVFFLARRPDNPRRRQLKSMLHHLRSIL